MLIVLYPYVTGLVAGAFIMASLVRVFNVKALEPIYRLFAADGVFVSAVRAAAAACFTSAIRNAVLK